MIIMCIKFTIYTIFYCCFIYLCVEGRVDINIVFPCKTPNNEEASCVSIFSCPPLMKALGSLDESSIDFVRKSVCCGCTPGDMKVCCGTKSYFVNINRTQNVTLYPPKLSTLSIRTTTVQPQSTSIRQKSYSPKALTFSTQTSVTNRDEKRKLLPSRAYCGYQHTDDRFYEKTTTALDEFPWLAHVIFLEDKDQEPDQYLDRCNGVLINNRYVLTSDYCASYAPRVRLGQYNTNKTVVCVEDPDAPECSEPWLELDVEEEIHRVDYGDLQYKAAYDFALLRLNKSVSFSDFIRPICLPLVDTVRPTKDQSFYFSGWGALDSNMIQKKRLVFNLTSADECYKIDKDLKKDSANISLMCLKPKELNGEIACTGDEAGPLTYLQHFQWFLEGIIMKVYHDGGDGAERCSNTHPINAARITPEIIDWILDTIRS